MLRITRKERGKSYTRDAVQPYEETYTQPLFNYINAWLYHHIWERFSWRYFRFLEKRWPGRFGQNWETEDGWDFHVPPTNVQDLKCYDLSHKNRKQVSMTYGEARSFPRKEE